MAKEPSPTNPVINLIANFAHNMFDPTDKDVIKAKENLRSLWETIMKEGTSLSLTQDYIDRCSEGGFAVHYPAHSYPSVLNCFVKKAPSLEWAEQAYKFASRYHEHEKFRMAKPIGIFEYDDGLILSASEFILGMDLDTLMLNANLADTISQNGQAVTHLNYAPHVEAIAKRCLDDLVFWQHDSREVMDVSLPPREGIIAGLKSNVRLAVQNARQYGQVDMPDEELEQLETALNIFDRLTIDPVTSVPVADYCPKNIGISKGKMDVGLDEIVDAISNKSRPDSVKIANTLSHWDPSAKWGHFLEDFFAFFDSYELGLFNGKKEIVSMDERYNAFLALKYRNDPAFRGWADSIEIRGKGPKKAAKLLMLDKDIMQFYRATRKADLSLTRYAWTNQKVSQNRADSLYCSTAELLPKHISFYSDSAIEAMKSLIRGTVGDGAQVRIQEVEQLGSDIKRTTKYFGEAYAAVTHQDKLEVHELYLLHIANRLKGRRTNYRVLSGVQDPAEFSKPRR